MNARAEPIDAFEPTTSAPLRRAPAASAASDTERTQTVTGIELPLNDVSVARAATPDVVRRAVANEPASSDVQRVTKVMDWVVVLTLVGLFLVGGLL